MEHRSKARELAASTRRLQRLGLKQQVIHSVKSTGADRMHFSGTDGADTYRKLIEDCK